MFSLKIPSKLVEYEEQEVTKIKDDAISYLSSHDFDYCGCADSLGIPITLLFEIRERFKPEFLELHMRFLAKCEHVLVQAALGYLDLSEKGVQPQVQHCKWVLERQVATWNKTQKVQIEDKRIWVETTPKVQQLLEEHERKVRPIRLGRRPGESLETDESDGGSELP